MSSSEGLVGVGSAADRRLPSGFRNEKTKQREKEISKRKYTDSSLPNNTMEMDYYSWNGHKGKRPPAVN
jgi:hypothetical protein